MKKLFSFIAVLALTTCGAFAEWQTDYKAALEQAANEKKMVLLDFTGSDWCGWCMKLEKETFSHPTFEHYAAENLVLVRVDFPHTQQLAPELKAQNFQLQSQYAVQGYPTLILLDSSGKEIARQADYLPGGPQAFKHWVASATKK